MKNKLIVKINRRFLAIDNYYKFTCVTSNYEKFYFLKKNNREIKKFYTEVKYYIIILFLNLLRLEDFNVEILCNKLYFKYQKLLNDIKVIFNREKIYFDCKNLLISDNFKHKISFKNLLKVNFKWIFIFFNLYIIVIYDINNV